MTQGIQNTAKGGLEQSTRSRPPRAFYSWDQVLKKYSFDDAVYYQSLIQVTKRTDKLITGFSNLRRGGKQAYLALTTKFISVIDEESKTVQFELTKIHKIFSPNSAQVTFEYAGNEVGNAHPRATAGSPSTWRVTAGAMLRR
jgi:hypothetical protein